MKYTIKVTRLNQDGSRDTLNTLEASESNYKRIAATWSRERNVRSTVFDDNGPIGQWFQGHRVAWASK